MQLIKSFVSRDIGGKSCIHAMVATNVYAGLGREDAIWLTSLSPLTLHTSRPDDHVSSQEMRLHKLLLPEIKGSLERHP